MNLALNKETRSKSHIAACFIVILLLAICLATCLSSCKLFASEIVIKDLEIKAEIREDGSVRFTETSKAHFSSQDTNWWNYYRVIDDETLIKKMSEHGGFKIDGDSFYVDGKKVDPYKDSFDEKGFRDVFGFDTVHPFTGVDYIEYYNSLLYGKNKERGKNV